MKILVCISHVPDTTSKINFKDNNTEFDSNGVQYIINPNDEFGLTRAVWLKQKNGATIDVINVGLSNTESTLKKALAIGADRAIRIDSEPMDGMQVAKEIEAICKKENYDLIIAGRESIDYNGGMVPGLLAGLLNIDYVPNCIRLEIEGESVKIEREIEGGKETLSSSLPLVIAGQKGLVEENDLIIPNMRGIMMARKKPMLVKAALGASQHTQSEKYELPKPKSEVKLISSDNIDELIHLLHTEAKVLD